MSFFFFFLVPEVHSIAVLFTRRYSYLIRDSTTTFIHKMKMKQFFCISSFWKVDDDSTNKGKID